jgi:enoyl-CoA hydratase
MSNPLIIDRTGATLVLTFNRPELRSPLSVQLLGMISDAIDGISEDVERVVFSGAGRSFASGADLSEIGRLNPEEAKGFAMLGQTLMQKIADLSQETIAAVNGACYGGALDLALACKQRIASPAATFCHPGTGLGIMTGWGGTQRLPRLIGEANALEMFFTASPITAERALKIGLIDRISEDVLAEAMG